MYKTLGKACLTWGELEEMILDIETTLNNRPLGYIEDNVQFPILTLSMMMFGLANRLPVEDALSMKEVDLRKQANICKDANIHYGHTGRGSTPDP